MDRQYDLAEVAASIYRLMTKLDPEATINQPWEHLSLTDQAAWLRLAKVAPGVMENLEGEKLSLAAFSLYLEMVGSDPESRKAAAVVYHEQMPPKFHLRWQVIARHLYAIMDCDQLDSLEESENLWVEWYRRLLPEYELNFVPMNGDANETA